MTRTSTARRDVPRLVLVVLLYSLPLVAAIRPVTDPDIWFHLRHGQWMLEHGRVLDSDPFSWTASGKRWIAYTWLFEVMVYLLDHALGVSGLVLYTAVLSLAIAAALHMLVASVGTAFTPGCILTAAAICAIAPLLVNPRPWLFSILFFAVELAVLYRVRRLGRDRLLWFLPPLFVLWANVHIQFVYGLVLLAMAAAEPLIEHALGRSQRPEAEGFRFPRMVVIVLASIGATLATPFFMRIYLPVFDTMGQAAGVRYLQEFQALSFRWPAHWVVLGMALSTAFALGWRKEVRLFPIISVAAGAMLAFRWARDVWFLVGVSLPILGACWPARSDGDRLVTTDMRKAVVGAGVAGVAALLIVTRVGDGRLETAVAKTYPVAAAAIVEQRNYGGFLYNHYDWGGYLMWRLPRLPVSIDGRMPLYGGAELERSIRTWGGHAGWGSDPELSSAHVVIGSVKERLVGLLRTDPRFELAYEDQVAAVFVARRTR